MNLLLDTHAFLWFMEGSERIGQRARDGIEAAGGVRALSIASTWEMAIKTTVIGSRKVPRMQAERSCTLPRSRLL